MKNILTIMKKEFARFFKDKRLVIMLVLPGVLIYLIYSVLGQGIFDKLGGVDENYVYQIYTVNMPESFKLPFEGAENVELKEISAEEAESVKEDVADQKTDLLAVFPENFEELYEAAKNDGATEYPQVQLFYNTVRTEGAQAFSLFTSAISVFQQEIKPFFFVDPQDLATDKDVTGMMFSMIAPMLVLMFLFSGCMAVAPESIAGEKERGTFATMLVTPVKRSHIAIGKIISLSVLSLLSGLCSFLGLILSLPKLMSGAGEAGAISAAVYTAGDYLMLLGIILSSVLVIVALISVISAYAKSVKEASTMIGPLMILVMLLGISTMFSSGATGSYLWYLIPLYNSARAMNGIFSFAGAPIAVAVTILVNVAAAVLLALALAKMFDSERIMFNK